MDYQAGIVDLTFDEKQVARFIPRAVETEEETADPEVSDEETAE